MRHDYSRLRLRLLLLVIAAFSIASTADHRVYGGEGIDGDIKVTPDVVYGHKHGLALTFDAFRPRTNPNGAGVLFMVSGGWHSHWQPAAQMLPLFRSLCRKGFTVFAVRHGSSPKFTIPEIADDVRRSVRFVRLNAEQLGVDPQRLGVFGGSAGGHLALILGTTADDGDPRAKDPVLRTSDRVAAVVAIYPPTDIRPFVTPKSPFYERYPALQFDPAKAAEFSPVANVSKDDPPTLLIHGDRDKLVEIDHSLKILKEFQQKGVTSKLLTIEGGGHGFNSTDTQRTTEEMAAWFEKFLVKRKAR